MIILKEENVDIAFKDLSKNGVEFVNEPIDMASLGNRMAHLRDLESVLIEIFSELQKDKWSQDLLDDTKEYEK